jgi:hypothetical protein
MIDFRGTQASVYSAVVIGIYCESNNCALIGNMVRGSWARSAGSFTSSYAIKNNGNKVAVVGNWANGNTNHDMWIDGTGGIVIGNVVAGTNVIVVGANGPTTAPYNVNGALPRADQNAGTVV